MRTRDREFVVEIARAIVAPVDPESVRFVEADAEAYFADPRRALARPGSQKPLGSGLEVAVTGLTVAAVYIADKSLGVFVEVAVKTAADRARQFFKRRSEPSAPLDVPAFSEEQREQVRDAVVAVAKGRGLDATAAEALAEAVCERLPRDPGAATGR